MLLQQLTEDKLVLTQAVLRCPCQHWLNQLGATVSQLRGIVRSAAIHTLYVQQDVHAQTVAS